MKNIILIATLAFAVFLAGCSSASHKVTGTLREPIPPAAVRIYSVMPPNAEVVGLIAADSFAGTTLQDASQDALQKLRFEAGRLGANGVVVESTNDKPLDGAKIQAKAIYIAP